MTFLLLLLGSALSFAGRDLSRPIRDWLFPDMYHEGLSFLFLLSLFLCVMYLHSFRSPCLHTMGLTVINANPHQRLSQSYVLSAGHYLLAPSTFLHFLCCDLCGSNC
ncbi:hypothetical protein ASPBRDRAFT_313692 [Aspergillus brasiliensis CBS 101740]|uniref:Uncharacterized protein n=1 Tax=Aspergillus brasiliensis (strain CBS 101740 / IMI 381727 / IBT 21946) TaxID=767769 RepID=A0A1L9UAQ7_ASPBC|nr:hypothetical protein ASPBRDRAFT_313692 [Aspergillus brasiliensis CBS 101740]